MQFHATAIYASGGMVLAGDDLTKLPPTGMGVLKRFLPPAGVAAEFEDETLAAGIIPTPGKPMVCAFNWEDEPRTVIAKLPKPGMLVDFWTGAALGRHDRTIELKQMAPHSARLLAYR